MEHDAGDSPQPQLREQARYRPARISPAAIVASVTMLAGLGAGLATLDIVGEHHRTAHLTTIAMRDLDLTPPPPPPAPPEPQRLDPVTSAAPVTAPRPLIELPAPGPRQVMVDAPPPRPVPFVAPAPVAAAPQAAAPAATAAAPAEAGDLSSKVIFAKPPEYPIDARRAREQGTVKLRVLVGSDGTVKDIAIATGSGSRRLDEAALRAVRRWRWSPVMNDGAPVAVRGYVTIPFVLTGA